MKSIDEQPARWKYCLSALLLILPAWFYYQSLNPELPPEWSEQRVGPFTAAPTPADTQPAYVYDGVSLKDFSVRFCEGCRARMRTAYLVVGPEPAAIPAGYDGIVHGHGSYAHVHVPYPERPAPEHRLWLTVQEWDGRLHQVSWPLPQSREVITSSAEVQAQE
ncbi:MAG: hypothetical protein WED00_10470 [Aquisalimonadaceae bacterium]